MCDENIEASVTNNNKPLLGLGSVRDSTLRTFLDYEIRSSWWASWISIGWMQELSGKYFAWKTSRKVARYKASKVWEQRVKNYL